MSWVSRVPEENPLAQVFLALHWQRMAVLEEQPWGLQNAYLAAESEAVLASDHELGTRGDCYQYIVYVDEPEMLGIVMAEPWKW